jgi:glucose/arabinose dehydrogenase
MPPPNATPSADMGPHMVHRPPGALPKAPPGFEVDLLTEGLKNPRKITTAPNGDFFIAEGSAGRVTVVRHMRAGASPSESITITSTFAEHLHEPFGIAFFPLGSRPRFVYVANTDSVVRFEYQNGDLKARGAPEPIVPAIPGGGHLRGGGHWTRDLAFSKDGKKLFVSIGSHSNVNDDADEKDRADVLAFKPDGSDFKIYSSGIRNPVGLAIEPKTGQLWASVNERDGLGDDVPPDYITRVQENGFYGWPWFYIGDHQDPRHAGNHSELAAKVIVPDVLLQAHSASLCMTFYNARQFPARYRGRAFAAEHGSWNRAHRTGYKVISVPIENGRATGEYEDFLTGFVTEAGDVWGRPVGVAVDLEGSLVVTDDGGNRVWRVRYTGKSH